MGGSRHSSSRDRNVFKDFRVDLEQTGNGIVGRTKKIGSSQPHDEAMLEADKKKYSGMGIDQRVMSVRPDEEKVR